MTEQMGAATYLRVRKFVAESNLIEGIDRNPTDEEVDATLAFLKLERVLTVDVCALQRVYAPRKPLRTRVGMDVRVGNYIAPAGGPEVAVAKGSSGMDWAGFLLFISLIGYVLLLGFYLGWISRREEKR